jgi:leucyl aminopeptidase
MEWLKSDVADLNNISEGGLAGATTAALFLREFVPEGVHWAHLDIAGTFLAEKNWKYYRPGATGVMVRSMVALAERLAGKDGKRAKGEPMGAMGAMGTYRKAPLGLGRA